MVGYTPEKEMTHVYLKDGYIHLYIYDPSQMAVSHFYYVSLPTQILSRLERAYASQTLYSFARKVAEQGFRIEYNQMEQRDCI